MVVNILVRGIGIEVRVEDCNIVEVVVVRSQLISTRKKSEKGQKKVAS